MWLEIKPFRSFHQTSKYIRYFSTVNNLKVVSESWSEEKGFNILVSVLVPLALGRLLRDVHEVARVYIGDGKSADSGKKQGYKKMVMVVDTPEPSPGPVLV